METLPADRQLPREEGVAGGRKCCPLTDTEFETVREYLYPDANGVVLLKQIRERGLVHGTKRIRKFARNTPDTPWDFPSAVVRRTPEMRGYLAGLLYNLPALSATPTPSRLYVTEGEKDAAALVAAGCPAVSHHQGGAGWAPEQAAHFRGYRGAVTVVADRDGAGAWIAARTYDLLRSAGLAATDLRVVVSAVGAPGSGADASDHLAAGHPPDAFVPVGLGVLRKHALRYVTEGVAVGAEGHYHP